MLILAAIAFAHSYSAAIPVNTAALVATQQSDCGGQTQSVHVKFPDDGAAALPLQQERY